MLPHLLALAPVFADPTMKVSFYFSFPWPQCNETSSYGRAQEERNQI